MYMLEVERDTDMETSAFSALLNSPATEELGGGNLLLASERVGSGSPETGCLRCTWVADGIGVEKPGIEGAVEVFRQMGIDISYDRLTAEETQDGIIIKGVQVLNGRRIFNRSYEISFASGGLKSMRGGRILGTPLICDATPSVSLATAVFVFTDTMIRNGTPIREITEANLGYYAERSAPGFTR